MGLNYQVNLYFRKHLNYVHSKLGGNKYNI